MSKTKINWADYSWNPIIGCSKVSAGCAACYAERMAARLAANPLTPQYQATVKDGHWSGKTVLVESELEKPLCWKKPRRVFVCSMADLFHEATPDGWIDRVLAVMAVAPQHTYLILTKRAKRMAKLAPRLKWTPNIWAGVSVEDQKTADERIPLLLTVPAAKRFVSYEPALGPVGLSWYLEQRYYQIDQPTIPPLDWVIAGGESGPGARPAHPSWFRSVRDQCAAAGVPFWFKQWGEWAPLPPFAYSPAIGSGHREYSAALSRYGRAHSASVLVDDRREGWSRSDIEHGMPITDGEIAIGRVGKKAAGCLLDGREHKEWPE